MQATHSLWDNLKGHHFGIEASRTAVTAAMATTAGVLTGVAAKGAHLVAPVLTSFGPVAKATGAIAPYITAVSAVSAGILVGGTCAIARLYDAILSKNEWLKNHYLTRNVATHTLAGATAYGIAAICFKAGLIAAIPNPIVGVALIATALVVTVAVDQFFRHAHNAKKAGKLANEVEKNARFHTENKFLDNQVKNLNSELEVIEGLNKAKNVSDKCYREQVEACKKSEDQRAVLEKDLDKLTKNFTHTSRLLNGFGDAARKIPNDKEFGRISREMLQNNGPTNAAFISELQTQLNQATDINKNQEENRRVMINHLHNLYKAKDQLESYLSELEQKNARYENLGRELYEVDGEVSFNAVKEKYFPYYVPSDVDNNKNAEKPVTNNNNDEGHVVGTEKKG